MRVWRVALCKLRSGQLCRWEMRKFCVDVFLACGFGVLLCVNCVRGSWANRCENCALMSFRHAGGFWALTVVSERPGIAEELIKFWLLCPGCLLGGSL